MCGVSADLKKIIEFQLTKLTNLTVQASTPQHFPKFGKCCGVEARTVKLVNFVS